MNKFETLVESVLCEGEANKKFKDLGDIWLALDNEDGWGMKLAIRSQIVPDLLSGANKDSIKAKAKEMGIKFRMPRIKMLSDLIATILDKEVYFDGTTLVDGKTDKNLVSNALGKELSLAEIIELAK